MSTENVLKALEGKPYEAMSLDDVMTAIELGQPFVGEPGVLKEIIRLARLGLAQENEEQGSARP